MVVRDLFLVVFTSFLASGQNPLSGLKFGGSGNDSVNGIAVDSAGNIYVAGTTTSFDLPLLNAFQNSNSGTQLIYSADEGATWQALSNVFSNLTPLQPVTMAVEPTNSKVLYVGASNMVCESTDAGKHFTCASLPVRSVQTTVSSLAVDPFQPSTVYASASVNGGVFKSTDGGQTWTNRSAGLPANGFIDSISIDPFHPNVLYAWAGGGGFRSIDGANSWQPSNLPWAGASIAGGIRFIFDPVRPGIIYGPGFSKNLFTWQKTTDGGQTWTTLDLPFRFSALVPDPTVSGILYAQASPNLNGPGLFWKSTDGGATWTSFGFPANHAGGLAVDPVNSNILISGTYRTTDGGITWNPTGASRDIQPVFVPSPSGMVYATAPITSDAFVAKFLPDGQTLVFSTYIGGMGNENVRAVALDNAGNIWVTGSTSSFDFPVTSGPYQAGLKGASNVFVTALSSDGRLLASTYLGSSGQDFAGGIAADPQGNVWLTGSTNAADFPVTVAESRFTPVLQAPVAFLSELDPSASQLLYSREINGTGKGIAIDPSGNVTVTGTTSDPHFPVTPGVFQNGAASSLTPKAFVLKVDPSGQAIYSTSFGGSHSSPQEFASGEHDYGSAVAVDQQGNAYVAGYTSATDFPTSPGVYQTSLADGCPYAVFTNNTGLIGTIFSVYVDDVFVVKLSADGKTLLYSTLLGGPCYDTPSSIAVDGAGQAYVAGETDSAAFPLAAPFQGAPRLRQFKSFLSVINSDGSALALSSYVYAGSSPSIAAGGDGTIYLGGAIGPGAQTRPDYSAFDPFPPIATDGYFARITPPASIPALSLNGVVNAFSLSSGSIAPGEIVSLSVQGYVPAQPIDLGLAPASPLSTTLGGAQVLFDGQPAYLLSVAAGRIVCIVPTGIAGQSSTVVQVNANGSLSNALTMEVAPTALGLLSADGSGTGPANARNSDGQLNSQDQPAARGSLITLYFTGAGVTNPAEADGTIVSGANPIPIAKITASLGAAAGGDVSALQGFVPGIFAITVQVPGNTAGTVLSLAVGSSSSNSQTLRIFVQ